MGRSGQETTLPLTLQRIENTVLNVSSAARTMSFVFKTDGRTKPAVDQRFIRGLSAVDQQGEKRPSFLAADQCTDAFLFLKPFSCKACPGIIAMVIIITIRLRVDPAGSFSVLLLLSSLLVLVFIIICHTDGSQKFMFIVLLDNCKLPTYYIYIYIYTCYIYIYICVCVCV